MIHIVVDAMGGDHAPHQIIKGAVEAASLPNIQLTLVGIESVIRSTFTQLTLTIPSNVTIQHASQVVEMGESPSKSFRQKKESSIRVGIDLVKAGTAQAFVSAGNTGAVMATSLLVLGRIEGIERPAIATIMPSKSGPFIMLDMGASVDSKPSHLVQFAIMGKSYSKIMLKVDTPKVGLLNIGEEVEKGNALTQAVFELLTKRPNLNFVGNVEGKHILNGEVDVVVADGFVGNSMLKFGEGAVDLFFDFFKSQAKASWKSLLGLWLLKKSLKEFKVRYDYSEYGGAPLLGVNGVSIVAHGRSDSTAIYNAIRQAYQAVSYDMLGQLKAELTC